MKGELLRSIWQRIRRQLGDVKKSAVTPVSIFMADNPAYAKYRIGVGTYGNPVVMDWGSQLAIGKYCSIAEGVTFLLGGNHRHDWITTYPFNTLWQGFSEIQGHPATKGDIVVGNDVWIGINSLILSGVRIGDGAVIGAGSIVTKDVPNYSIVAGNPARFIRLRFSEDIVKSLVKSAWWDLKEDEIRKLTPLLMDNTIDVFFEKINRLNSERKLNHE